MKRKLFSLRNSFFLGVFLIVTAIFSVVVLGQGNFSLHGKLTPPYAWMGGHSEKVWFLTGGDLSGPDDNFIRPSIGSDGRLFGNFWLGSAGWATFGSGVNQSFAQIICPSDILVKNIDPCYLSGAAWSQSVGWILLGSGSIGSGYSGVYFNPNSANLEGFAWNEGLGWIPFFTGLNLNQSQSGEVLAGSGVVVDYTKPNTAGGLSVNFIGRVAVLGNIAGTKVFAVANNNNVNLQDPGYAYSTVQHASILNAVRTNVAQLVRNASDDRKNPNDNFNFIYQQGGDYCFGSGTPVSGQCQKYDPSEELYGSGIVLTDDTLFTTWNTGYPRSVIVRGGDIVIDSDFNISTDNTTSVNPGKMVALIALKDASGKGGNIIITNNVKRIYAYIVAEGSVYSGYKTSTGIVSYYQRSNPFSVPVSQLYINGIVISKNTIGGATDLNSAASSVCPILTPGCTSGPSGNAENYDMAYFRNYNSQDADDAYAQSALKNTARYGITDDRVRKAPFIIDYNANILSDPPPGLRAIW